MTGEIKRIERIRRATSSVNGNPAFWITFTDGRESRTTSDAAWAYEVGNPGMREGCLVVVEFSRAGWIRHMRPTS